MFGVGFSEMLIIAIVALVFVGPKRLPELMRQGGKLFVQMRRVANDVRSQVDHVIRDAEDELRRAENLSHQKLLERKLVEAQAAQAHVQSTGAMTFTPDAANVLDHPPTQSPTPHADTNDSARPSNHS